jgi:S1-C subfamily serine protease
VTAPFASGEQTEILGVIDVDDKTDVAVVSLPAHHRPLLALTIQPPAVGEHVYTLGAPRGLDFSISDGIVSQNRAAEGLRVIQFTAPAVTRRQWRPLLNDQGAVIGVISRQIAAGQNLNFAVAATHIANLDATMAARQWTPGPQKSAANVVAPVEPQPD